MQTGLISILERIGSESRIHYSLDHFHKALEAAGSPHHSVQTLVVSGTNGKGSVSLLVSAALHESGLRVGTYLSPHLQHPRERFLLGMQSEEPALLDTLACRREGLAQEHKLTYFEFLTLLAFDWAQLRQLDMLVLEVGLGGRLDAVNVTTPRATALTTIGLDHQQWLGNSHESILREKLGVTRPGVPLYSGLKDPALTAQARAFCQAQGTPLHLASAVAREAIEVDWKGQTVRIDGHPFRLTHPGRSAVDNAVLAYQLVRGVFPDIAVDTIQKAFAQTRNPGRFQVVQDDPRVILSGDHNPDGIEDLIHTLKTLDCQPHILCAFSPDKPAQAMVEKLRTVARSLSLTTIPRFASALPPGYSTLAPFEPDPHKALDALLKQCADGSTALVTGSLYLVGEFAGRWN